MEEWLRRQSEGAPLKELNALAEEAMRRRRSGQEVSVAAGQISGMVKKIENAGDIVKEIIEEATAICESLGSLPQAD